MQSLITVNNHAPRLLLFFCGWGTDATVASQIAVNGYDTMAVWDYRGKLQLSIPDRYDEIVVAAWSFGVAAAARWLADNPRLPVTRRIAFNGTLYPVDDTRGIPEAIFRGTLERLDPRNLQKFYRRMARTAPFTPPDRPIDELKAELEAIAALEVPHDMAWDHAFISDGDLIIPPGNQRRAWADTPVSEVADSPHLPDFATLLRGQVIDKELVAQRFSSAQATYADTAGVQRHIASRLIGLAEIDPSDAIEIGSGTGFLSQLFKEKYPDGRLTRVDLMALDGAVKADAEQWIRTRPDASASAIISSSTMQWFNSQPGFLKQVERVLRPGGVALLSTFGPRTFGEFEGLAPRLPYIDRVPYEHSREVITLTFSSPMEVMRHLRLTGVNGVASAPAVRLVRNYPLRPDGTATLTFEPIYIVIRK